MKWSEYVTCTNCEQWTSTRHRRSAQGLPKGISARPTGLGFECQCEQPVPSGQPSGHQPTFLTIRQWMQISLWPQWNYLSIYVIDWQNWLVSHILFPTLTCLRNEGSGFRKLSLALYVTCHNLVDGHSTVVALVVLLNMLDYWLEGHEFEFHHCQAAESLSKAINTQILSCIK